MLRRIKLASKHLFLPYVGKSNRVKIGKRVKIGNRVKVAFLAYFYRIIVYIEDAVSGCSFEINLETARFYIFLNRRE